MTGKLEIGTIGYHVFCKILRTLKSGGKVAPDTWVNLSSCMPYKRSFEIMEKEMGISRKNYIKWVTQGVTGKPPKPVSMIQWLTNMGRTKGFAHYAADHIDEIELSVTEFKNSEFEVLQWVEKRLRDYLPSNIQIPSTKLYFVFGSGDGRIFYDEATFDVTLAYVLGLENTKGMIAHELHHMARNKEYGDWTESTGAKFILSTLEAEGVADMVFSIHSSTLARQDLPIVTMMMQSQAYNRVDEILKEMDELVSKAYPREPNKNKLYRLFTKNAFHPVGHVMAQRIENCLGRASLVDCVGNPVKFMKAYQLSAESSNGYKFSSKTIGMIDNIFAK